MFKIQKKDGSLQDFDRNKVIGSVLKSGGTNADAESVTSKIEVWLPTAAVDGVVKSQDIRNKVLEVLRNVNQTAATAFESYSKPN